LQGDVDDRDIEQNNNAAEAGDEGGKIGTATLEITGHGVFQVKK
jgi:hypothetical protein